MKQIITQILLEGKSPISSWFLVLINFFIALDIHGLSTKWICRFSFDWSVFVKHFTYNIQAIKHIISHWLKGNLYRILVTLVFFSYITQGRESFALLFRRNKYLIYEKFGCSCSPWLFSMHYELLSSFHLHWSW